VRHQSHFAGGCLTFRLSGLFLEWCRWGAVRNKKGRMILGRRAADSLEFGRARNKQGGTAKGQGAMRDNTRVGALIDK
jgi:hypothetical protein